MSIKLFLFWEASCLFIRFCLVCVLFRNETALYQNSFGSCKKQLNIVGKDVNFGRNDRSGERARPPLEPMKCVY